MNDKENIKRRHFIRAGAAAACAAALLALPGRSKNMYASTAGPKKGFLKPVPSPWFSQTGNNQVLCKLCPKNCKLSEGQRAVCKVRKNRGGKGYTLAYGNPALIQEDPVERKPFYHVLPGSRALSISTAGCNLSCKFCEVWDMALAKPEEVYAYHMPPESIVEHAVDSGVRSLSYAFGEPVIFYEYMSAVAELAKDKKLLNLVHTAGYINSAPLKKLTTLIDAVNVDLKSFDHEFYKNIVGGELNPVLNALKILKKEGVHIEITNIVIPTLNDDMKMIEKMCKWIRKELGAGTPLHFARFYPLFKLSSLPRTPVSTLDRARETAMNTGLDYVYVSRVTGHKGENTFCPGCEKKIIDRVGFIVDDLKIKKNNCRYCGAKIPGIWE